MHPVNHYSHPYHKAVLFSVTYDQQYAYSIYNQQLLLKIKYMLLLWKVGKYTLTNVIKLFFVVTLKVDFQPLIQEAADYLIL